MGVDKGYQYELSLGFGFGQFHLLQHFISLVPSGYVKIAMEHGPVEIVDIPIRHGDFP